MQGTVWNTGCASWYLDETGRNSTLWPDLTWRFRRRTARFDPADFELSRPSAEGIIPELPVTRAPNRRRTPQEGPPTLEGPSVSGAPPSPARSRR